jgi:hypothetical protein
MQLGTANIHQIPLGNRAYTRISKEDYGERLQEMESGDPDETDEESDEDGEESIEYRARINTKKTCGARTRRGTRTKHNLRWKELFSTTSNE